MDCSQASNCIHVGVPLIVSYAAQPTSGKSLHRGGAFGVLRVGDTGASVQCSDGDRTSQPLHLAPEAKMMVLDQRSALMDEAIAIRVERFP